MPQLSYKERESRVKQAYEAFLSGAYTNVSLCAREFACNRQILQNRIHGIPSKLDRHPTCRRHTKMREQIIVDYITRLDDMNMSLTIELVVDAGNRLLSLDARPLGEHWFRRFYNRHPDLKTRQATEDALKTAKRVATEATRAAKRSKKQTQEDIRKETYAARRAVAAAKRQEREAIKTANVAKRAERAAAKKVTAAKAEVRKDMEADEAYGQELPQDMEHDYNLYYPEHVLSNYRSPFELSTTSMPTTSMPYNSPFAPMWMRP